MIVADASVAVRWTIDMPLSDAAEALLRGSRPIIAPDLVIAEVANAFATAVRHSPATVQRARDGLDFLPRWFAELVALSSLRNDAFKIAVDLAHPAHDCFYLALAEQRDCPLLTTDERLLQKVAGSPHAGRVTHLREWT